MVWCITVLVPACGDPPTPWRFTSISAAGAGRGRVGVLYLTLGFRQFSHHFTDIRDAGPWRRRNRPSAPGAVAPPGRQRAAARGADPSRDRAFAAGAHRHVFGVFSGSSSARRWAWAGGRGRLPSGRVCEPLLGLQEPRARRPTNVQLLAVSRRPSAGSITCRRHPPPDSRWSATSRTFRGWREMRRFGLRPTKASCWPHRRGAGPAQAGRCTRSDARSQQDLRCRSADPRCHRAAGSTAGAAPSSGTCKAWWAWCGARSSLWMGLLALLTLANLVG